MKILVTPTSLQPDKNSKALERLKKFSDNLTFNNTGRPLTEEELIPLLKDCDGYIAGLDNITKKVIESCPRLKVISRYGTGTDRVDLKAAREHHIAVTNTPGANAEAVGELAFGLALSLARNIPSLSIRTSRGEWTRSTGMELAGKTIGIIGLGAIGRVVARCAQGFSMKVISYDPFMDASYASEHGIEVRGFEELLSQAEIITLHLPLTDQTRHMINSETIQLMKDNVILINASRGGIIDETAACEGLKTGKIGGLGLDAFEKEPPVDSPLLAFDNVVATPHTGAHTKEAAENMAVLAVENLISVLTDQTCPYIVN
ncbi:MULTISPECIES: phosphoglycerate dehydrogenase [Blautia]|uniref:phosphoglycerate dehydrogenase n=1 Tax=Blautia TaxID=572511 RepID=UPI000BA2F5A7|nr:MULTISPECIES: phosphoglycerate dehydrogenase [Blautia]